MTPAIRWMFPGLNLSSIITNSTTSNNLGEHAGCKTSGKAMLNQSAFYRLFSSRYIHVWKGLEVWMNISWPIAPGGAETAIITNQFVVSAGSLKLCTERHYYIKSSDMLNTRQRYTDIREIFMQ